MSGWLQALALAAFSAGLLGGVHCAAMCGGVLTACSPRAQHGGSRWRLIGAYNVGRIASYCLAGALVGGIGQSALALRAGPAVQHALLAVAGASMLMLAAYMAGMGRFVRALEGAGGVLWHRLQPYTRSFLPANTVPRALGLGALWGWLPCGMVYGVLLTALATGSAAEGAFIMLAFGAGTLPNLIAISAAAGKLKSATRNARVRKGAALALAAIGVMAIVGVIDPAAFGADGLLCVVPGVGHH